MQLDTAWFPIVVLSLLLHTHTQALTDTHNALGVDTHTHEHTCMHAPARDMHVHRQIHTEAHTSMHMHSHTQTHSHTYKDFPVSQLCFHQSFSLALQSSVSMVMCCAAWKAVKKLPPWMRDHGNSTGLLSSVCSGLLIIPLCRVMASCTVLSVSSQQTIVF